MANINDIILELQEQRDRLDVAISALSRIRKGPGRVGRPRKDKGMRRFSAAARKRISDAAKERWAKAKKEGRSSL